MEFGQIEAFLSVARLGSFTRAAEDLDLTQPSVSARVAALEQTVGGALFERGGRRMRLTTLGKTFLPYAERTLTAATDGLQAVQRAVAGQIGQVSIASLDTTALYILPEPMKRFREEYPSVDFTVRLRMTAQVIDILYDGEVSLGLIGAPMWDKNLRVLAHFQEKVRAIVSSAHALAHLQRKRGYVTVDELYDHTIYRVTLNPRVTAMVEGLVERARRGAGGAVVQIPSIMTRHLLFHGMGLAFLPEYYLMSLVQQGYLTFLDVRGLPEVTNEILLVSLRERELDRPTQDFVRMIRAQWRHILVKE